jgi:hypothetical protein
VIVPCERIVGGCWPHAGVLAVHLSSNGATMVSPAVPRKMSPGVGSLGFVGPLLLSQPASIVATAMVVQVWVRCRSLGIRLRLVMAGNDIGPRDHES